jgi:hypothetical protein
MVFEVCQIGVLRREQPVFLGLGVRAHFLQIDAVLGIPPMITRRGPMPTA